jgi:hypothetical protein
MLDLLAGVHGLVEGSIIGTALTLDGLHIEQRGCTLALHAFLPVVVRLGEGTVGDIMVLPTPLIILLNDVVDTLATQDPVRSVEVRLEDSGSEH